jgi:hypothetical protein
MVEQGFHGRNLEYSEYSRRRAWNILDFAEPGVGNSAAIGI